MFDPMQWVVNSKYGRYVIYAIVGALFAWIVYLNLKAEQAEQVWDSRARTYQMIPVLVWHEPDYSQATASALKIINDEVGCEFLKETEKKEDAVIIVKWYDGMPCGKMTELGFQHGNEGGAFYCSGGTGEVHIRANGDSRTHMVVIAHELTHLIGLVHDLRNKCLITWPWGHDTIACDIILMSRKDGKALHEKYCSK